MAGTMTAGKLLINILISYLQEKNKADGSAILINKNRIN